VTWNLGDLLRRLLGRRDGELPLDDLLKHPWDERTQPRTLSTTFQIGPRTISVTLDPVISTKEELLGAVAVFAIAPARLSRIGSRPNSSAPSRTNCAPR
jgi:hypothetical protein